MNATGPPKSAQDPHLELLLNGLGGHAVVHFRQRLSLHAAAGQAQSTQTACTRPHPVRPSGCGPRKRARPKPALPTWPACMHRSPVAAKSAGERRTGPLWWPGHCHLGGSGSSATWETLACPRPHASGRNEGCVVHCGERSLEGCVVGHTKSGQVASNVDGQ